MKFAVQALRARVQMLEESNKAQHDLIVAYWSRISDSENATRELAQALQRYVEASGGDGDMPDPRICQMLLDEVKA